ncbi:MAG: hypothetical protein KGN76_05145, partial [Acidobacteriota bacterium]|nr:hypothetical protein [Acidobacteriota bacterium]
MQDEEFDDLDRLVSELNDWRPGSRSADTGRLDRWLGELVERGGSDLFLVAGLPPTIRVAGAVVPLAGGPLDGPDIEDAVLPSLPAHAAQHYGTRGDADASLRRAGLGRFRVNLHHERGRPAASIRALPAAPPRLADAEPPEPRTAQRRVGIAARPVVLCGVRRQRRQHR